MSEPNDAQAVIAGVLRESLKPLVDPFNTGADSGWVETWCTTAAEAVDAALGRLTRERRTNAMSSAGMTTDTKTGVTTSHSDIRYDSRWVSGWTPEEARP